MKRGRKKYNDEYLLEKLQEAAVLLGGLVSTRDLRKLKGFPCASVYFTHFGWRNALNLLNLPIKPTKPPGNPKNPNAPLKLRFKAFERDNFTCQYCGRTPQDGAKLVVDHVNPVANGGLTVFDNLITSCFECNSGKSDLLLGQKKGQI